MRTSLIASLLLLFHPVLPAQEVIPDAFQVMPPSISARVERCTDFDLAHLRWINDLTVDSSGFLWCVSTLDGLARFDGYEARWYREDATDTLGRFKSAFTSVAIDGEGFVWSGSPAGVMRVDPATGQSRWYMDTPNDTTSVLPGSPSLLVTSEGEVWTGGNRGIAKYNRTSESFTCFSYPQESLTPSVPSSPLRGKIAFCQIGRSIWIGFQGTGIARFDRYDHTWKIYRHDPRNDSGPSSDNVFAVCGDRSGNLWVGSDTGLERYSPGTNRWQRPDTWRDASLRVPRIWVTGIVEDEYGGIWISTGGEGVFRVDPKQGHLLQLLHDPTDPMSIPFNHVANVRPWRSGGRPQSGRATAPPPTSIV
ncbi:MAG: hypothetical protein EHM80_05120, partial [Nitrospiraceae bacterium]